MQRSTAVPPASGNRPTWNLNQSAPQGLGRGCDKCYQALPPSTDTHKNKVNFKMTTPSDANVLSHRSDLPIPVSNSWWCFHLSRLVPPCKTLQVSHEPQLWMHIKCNTHTRFRRRITRSNLETRCSSTCHMRHYVRRLNTAPFNKICASAISW